MSANSPTHRTMRGLRSALERLDRLAAGRAARAVSINDLRELGRRRIPRVAFDYMDGGVEAEVGLRRNCATLDRLTLAPRYLVDVAGRSAATELFGRRYRAPLGMAPTGLANLVWPGTDEAIAAVAARLDLPFVLSTPATTSVETIAAMAPGSVWFQLYVSRERRITEDLVRRAREAGIDVLVLTVDVPVPAKRERDIRNAFTLPLRPTLANVLGLIGHPHWALATLAAGAPRFVNMAPYVASGSGAQSLAAFMAAQISPSITWNDLAWLRSLWPGRLVVKGVLTATDARLAVETGADGVIVSNHGGRQLDAAPASIEALPHVVAAVGSRVPVMLDSGVRRGSDIAKALAVGAAFVFVGRATLYGAAAGGAAGVERAVAILLDEFDRVLGQLGCNGVRDLTPDRLGLSAELHGEGRLIPAAFDAL